MQHFRLLAAMCTLALILAACGSDGDTDAAVDAATTTTAPADDAAGDAETDAEPTDEPAAEEPAEVEDELVILCTPQEEWCEAAANAFSPRRMRPETLRQKLRKSDRSAGPSRMRRSKSLCCGQI